MRGSKWTPAHTGKEGLFRLVRLAHCMYTEEVVTLQKSYHRFAIDFINSTLHHDNIDAWSKNEHQKNHQTISDLLTNHEKMVHRHFCCRRMDDHKLSNLLHEFYTCDTPKLKVPGDTVTDIADKACGNSMIILDNNTVDLIVRLANEVNLFTETLDIEETVNRYNRHMLKSVVSNNNARLALVLDRLSAQNIIPFNWQSLIEREKLILSSTGNKYLNRHDFAATLNRIKDLPLSPQNKKVLSIVDEYIKQIKHNQSI